MIKKALLNDNFIMGLIVLNAIVLFFDAFDSIHTKIPFLSNLDLFISLIFIIEMIFKIKESSWSEYIKNGWNKLDFFINISILPSFSILFLDEHSSLFFLTSLRLIRVIKFFKFFKFVPNIDHILKGLNRAMKSSVFIVFSFFLYLFIISIFSCFFFKEVSPDHFGDPLKSLYSTFKIFTIEGWFELPELISQKYGIIASFFVKVYFVFLVLSGGVFGVSLINAIFVDEMVSDNNDEVLKELKQIKEKLETMEDKLKK